MSLPILSIFEIGGKLIDKFFPDPADKDKARLQLLDMQQAGELQKIAAAAQVVTTEANSEHFLTATWRPITMLTFVAIIANNYIIAPYLKAIFEWNVVLLITPEMWDLLKIGLGGYVVSRGAEKSIKSWKGGGQ